MGIIRERGGGKLSNGFRLGESVNIEIIWNVQPLPYLYSLTYLLNFVFKSFFQVFISPDQFAEDLQDIE